MKVLCVSNQEKLIKNGKQDYEIPSSCLRSFNILEIEKCKYLPNAHSVP